MSKNKPKISVLIPTYNRAPFLRHTLESCVAQDYENVEIIVHDDASEDNTQAVVQSFVSADSRVRYVKSESNRGMRLNFEKGLTEVNGDYLICLGGDDALLPYSLSDLAQLIMRHPSDVISWPTASFIYESTRSKCGQIIAPHLMFKERFINRVDTSEYLIRQTENLLYVSDQQAPMLYVKSCVPMETINDIKSKSGGVFFKSSTPDGYSSFAISSVKKSYIFTNSSYTMHGVSANSAGLNYVGGNGGKQDLSMKFFEQNKDVLMAPQLGSAPYSPLITMMTADFLFETDNIFSHGFSNRISNREIIRRSLSELADGLYNEAKIKREIEILSQFADYVGEANYLLTTLDKVYRNMRTTLEGDAISSSAIYLNAGRLEVKNVYEAALFIKAQQNRKEIYLKLKIYQALLNSIRYKLKGMLKSKKLSNV